MNGWEILGEINRGMAVKNPPTLLVVSYDGPAITLRVTEFEL